MRNTHKVRRLFSHNMARHTTLRNLPEGKAVARANASEMAQAAIHRYDERHGLTRRALPEMKYRPTGKFKLDRQGEKELAARMKAHRVAELMRKRDENARLAPQRQLAQKAVRQAHKKSEEDVDELTGMMKSVNPFGRGRRTRRRHRHRRTRRSTRA